MWGGISGPNIKRGAVILLASFLFVAAASASEYFSVSNSITDEVDVVRENKRDPLILSYGSDGGLGGENKELNVGKWEEFQVVLKNKSPHGTKPWENIFIRLKLYGVGRENLAAEYRFEGEWKRARLHDIRTLEIGNEGSVSDLGPGGGWTIEPKTSERYSLRIKIGRAIENMRVELRAITAGSKLENVGERVKNPESGTVLEPVLDTYVDQRHPSEVHGGKSHLEISTEENGNSRVFLKFEKETLPDRVDSAKLNLYQYWGSGFAELRESGVGLELVPIAGKIEDDGISWSSLSKYDRSESISERKILGNRKWYNFDLTEHLNGLPGEEDLLLLLRFSHDNFDNEDRRIRFDSKEGENSPYIVTSQNNT